MDTVAPSTPRSLPGIGQLFSASFARYRQYRSVIIAAMLVVAAANIILAVVFPETVADVTPVSLLDEPTEQPTVGDSTLVTLITLIVSVWSAGVLLVAFGTNGSVRWTGVAGMGWRFFWPLLLVTLMQVAAALVGVILLIIPGILWSIWFMFAQPFVVAEGTRGTGALRASRELTRGYFWPILGRMAVVGLAMIGASIVLSPLPYYLETFVVSILITGFGWTAFYTIYLQMKAVKQQ